MEPSIFAERNRDMERRSAVVMLAAQIGIDLTTQMIEDLAVRGCGECVACCIYPAITQEQFTSCGVQAARGKPFGKMCGYCTGSGCAIYEERPETCACYMCYYRLGLTDTSPVVSKVAYSSMPAEGIPAFAVVGQCEDADAFFNDRERLEEVRNFLGLTLYGMPVAYVVIRDVRSVSRVRLIKGELVCDTCEADSTKDYVNVKSLRIRDLQQFAI